MAKAVRFASVAEGFDANAAGAAFMGRGNNWFVDGAYGDDDDVGRSWGTALKTLTAALGKCVTAVDDCIFVGNYGNQAEVYPINWNKKGVHVFGMSSLAYPQLVQSDAVDNPAIIFTDNTGGRSTFYNMAFATLAGESEIAPVKVTGTCYNIWFDRCQFGWMGNPASNGIYAEADIPDWLISRCIFDDAGILYSSISLLGSATRTVIRNCYFEMASGYHGITDAGGTGLQGVRILDNKFKCVDAAAGEAIELGTSSAGCVVDGNSAFEGNVAMTFNPYRDLASNHWGRNFRQGVSIAPAVI